MTTLWPRPVELQIENQHDLVEDSKIVAPWDRLLPLRLDRTAPSVME